MSVYVVTGGAGFIGANIAHHLVEDGHEVRVVDNFSTGRRSNLDRIANRIDLREGNICDSALLAEVFEGADYVLHQAALPSVQRSVKKPLATNRANVEGTLSVLEAARDSSVKRVVYASSSSVYGDKPTLPKVEDMKPDPRSPYATSKLAGEYYCGVYSDIMGQETACLRYFNVFGPYQNPDSQYAAVIPIFVGNALEQDGVTVFGDGEQSRDFTYIDNVVDANIRAATTQGADGEIFNVGCGNRYTLNTMLEMLEDMLGRPIESEYTDPRPGDVKLSQASIERAEEILDYEPAVGFREGLEKTVEWYSSQQGG